MPEVEFAVEDGVAVITLNRPEARNAVNMAVSQAVSDALDEIAARSEIRVGIVTGAGGNFCTGMDLKAFARGEAIKHPQRGFAGIAQAELAKPMIAAVEGYALGGGFEIALACDLIVASETARFALPEVRRGLVANAGGLVRLPRQVPRRIAAEMVFTGDFYSPDRLAGFGLINRVVPEGQALAAARELAARIAANAPLAIAASRRVFDLQQGWAPDELFQRQAEITASVMASEDGKEGARAFAEKRPPVWRGR